MHMDHHGFLDPIEDHLKERVLGNVYRILEPSGTHVRDNDARDDFGIIQKHRVMFYERGKSSN
jgi:hypothetical protein